jgi:hypothetical protein
MNSMPRANEGGAIAQDPAEWFKHRSYDYRQFSDLKQMARRKRERNEKIGDSTLCLRDSKERGHQRDAQFFVGN